MTTLPESRSDASKVTNDTLDNTCVVCFKNVDIFSIGECDHSICYECSTRMRVLCQKNECAICRKELSEVIFTKKLATYRDLQKIKSDCYQSKYKIRFIDVDLQRAFERLLEHACTKCDEPPFPSFEALANHVRAHHELYYCDICTQHLKIFSFERRCYNRKDLALHRRKGDADNTSYSGHPSCQLCDVRYFDKYELFRHSRHEHYFCHICDSDGCNLFYGDTESLRQHFREEHYVCEEEDCAKEVLTNVFPTEIDLKAHTARVHAKILGKRLTKQTRTLQVDINLGPRTRPNISEVSRTNTNSERIPRSTTLYHSPPQIIDAQNEQEFPSLGGATGVTASMPLLGPSMAMRNKLAGSSGIAKTRENFPALGASTPNTDHSGNVFRPSQMSVSSLLKNKPKKNEVGKDKQSLTASTKANNHINKNLKFFSDKNDFPALPGSSKSKPANSPWDDDYIPPINSKNLNSLASKHRSLVDDYVSVAQPSSKLNILLSFPGSSKSKPANSPWDDDYIPPINSKNLNSVASKHRSLVDDYVSVAQPSSKLNILLSQVEPAPKKVTNGQSKMAPQLTSNDFPVLGNQSHFPEINWGKNHKQNEKDNRDNRKAKTTSASTSITSQTNHNKSSSKNAQCDIKVQKTKKDRKGESQDKAVANSKGQENLNPKKNDSKQHKQKGKVADNDQKNKQKPKEANNNNNNNNFDISSSPTTKRKNNKNSNNNAAHSSSNNNNTACENEYINCFGDDSFPTIAPPGFEVKPKDFKPPPSKQSTNSIVNNNISVSYSFDERLDNFTVHQYLAPPDSARRNEELAVIFKSALKNPQAYDEFGRISRTFQEGMYKAAPYYEHCQIVLKDKFDEVFPELLALLPDIKKQQELLLVHSQYTKESGRKKNCKPKMKLEVCPVCQQVLLGSDIKLHVNVHQLHAKFPALSNKFK